MHLTADERTRVNAVIDAAERCMSLAGLLTTTLDAVDEHLGYRTAAFVLTLAERPFPGRRAYAGTDHGQPPYVLEEYFERWAHADPLGSNAARRRFAASGFVRLSDIGSDLDDERRDFVDDFLPRIGAPAQLCVRLPVGWTDGYLTLMRSDDFGERDRLALDALAAPLRGTLATFLPRGFDHGVSRREAHVSELVAIGWSNREIAATLNVEEDTVKKHVSAAMRRLGVPRRGALASAWTTGRVLDVRPGIVSHGEREAAPSG